MSTLPDHPALLTTVTGNVRAKVAYSLLVVTDGESCPDAGLQVFRRSCEIHLPETLFYKRFTTNLLFPELHCERLLSLYPLGVFWYVQSSVIFPFVIRLLK